MNQKEYVNLFIYSDSLAFRRKEDSPDLGVTYPFRLKALMESNLGIRVNLLLRGGGGANARDIKATLTKDSAYLGGTPDTANIAVLQFGIVDSAPRPFTYRFVPVLRRIPVIGPTSLMRLVKHRRGLQRMWSYTITPRHTFRRLYSEIVQTCYGAHIQPIAVGMPLPTLAIEQRSPGFRRNVSLYNEIIREVIPEGFCDLEALMTEPQRQSLLLPDGHHLTEEGHRLYAEQMFGKLRKHL